MGRWNKGEVRLEPEDELRLSAVAAKNDLCTRGICPDSYRDGGYVRTCKCGRALRDMAELCNDQRFRAWLRWMREDRAYWDEGEPEPLAELTAPRVGTDGNLIT